MAELATAPIIDNLADPEIAKHFGAPKKRFTAEDFARTALHVFIPMFINMYRQYASFRGSEYQTQLARRSYYIAMAVSLVLSYLWILSFQNLGGNRTYFVQFNFWNLAFWWMFFNTGMNIYSSSRFSKPDFRAYKIKFSPSKRAQVMRQLVRRLGTKSQIKQTARAGWKVDFFNCDARIDWTEFPDDTIQASCIGTDSKEWIWIRFNDDRNEKHYCVFGDLNYGKKNFVRVLIKALMGDPNTGIVIADADEAVGSSFAEYEPLLNVSLNLGIAKSLVAIEAVRSELRRREADRNLAISKSWPRIVLVLDNILGAGMYGFWRRALKESNVGDKLRRIARLLKEIADSGKMHNVHIVAVLDNTQLDYFAWMTMRTRFEAFGLYWQRKVSYPKKKGDKGEGVSEIAFTHQSPYMDVVSVIWPNGENGNILMKAPCLPEADFIQYVQSRSIYLSQKMKEFLQDIKMRKPE